MKVVQVRRADYPISNKASTVDDVPLSNTEINKLTADVTMPTIFLTISNIVPYVSFIFKK